MRQDEFENYCYLDIERGYRRDIPNEVRYVRFKYTDKARCARVVPTGD
jgi:hypothetical protein